MTISAIIALSTEKDAVLEQGRQFSRTFSLGENINVYRN